MYPYDLKTDGTKKDSGLPKQTTIGITDPPAGAPAAPRVSTTIPDYVKVGTLSVSGTKGNDCSKLKSNGTTIVTGTSTSWSYTFRLDYEWTNTFNLVCYNSGDDPSPTTVLTIKKDTTYPAVPVLDPVVTPTSTANQTLGGRKSRDCILWENCAGNSHQGR